MTSIEIIDFELTIKKYINEHPFPTELKRMVIKNILEELTANVQSEIIQQAQERENKEQENKQRTIYHEDSK